MIAVLKIRIQLYQYPILGRRSLRIWRNGYFWVRYQNLNLSVFFIIAGFGCWFEDTVVHEFIHAFGFHHEQVRPDRDNYVEIIYENIPGDKVHNFNLFTGSHTYGVQYDGFSVMHYSSTAFSNFSFGNGNTIESKVSFELMNKTNILFTWPFA